MKSGDMGKMQTLIGMAQDQDLKIERGLKFIAKMPKNKRLKELNAIEMEAKEFQKIVLQLQKLKGGLKRRSPDHARILSEIELIEDKEVDIHLKFQKVRKEILGISDGAAGGPGGNSKGVLMAAALGMKIGEQGVKKTEEILATLRKANNLMDSMQGDILEQRKKLHRIQDQVKNAQSLSNRGKEVMKYFANQGSKDVCIKVLVGLIAVMIIGMGVLTYQINQEREMIEASPEELAEQNLEKMGLEIDEDGKVKIDPNMDENNDGDYYMDNGNAEQLEENKLVKENYEKAKEEARIELEKEEEEEKKKKEKEEEEGSDKTDKDEEDKSEKKDKDEEDKSEKTGKDDDEKSSKKEEDEDRLLEKKLRERMLRRNRKVLISLHVG
jgi:hypothetical protein